MLICLWGDLQSSNTIEIQKIISKNNSQAPLSWHQDIRWRTRPMSMILTWTVSMLDVVSCHAYEVTMEVFVCYGWQFRPKLPFLWRELNG